MSALKVKQIKSRLLSLFESHLDLTDLPQEDREREAKVLTRCLAALAIYLQTGCNEEEAAQSVWDGQEDNGVDAAYFDAAETKIILVQSKWISKGSGEPSASDIGNFADGMRDVIEYERDRFHPRLHGKLTDINQHAMVPGCLVHAVLISTGSGQLVV